MEILKDRNVEWKLFKESAKDVMASIIGSAACVYTGQPFDTIKVRMQVNGAKYKGTIDCFKRTLGNENIFALWRGSLPAFAGALGENAVAFGVNGTIKRVIELLRVDKDKPHNFEPFLTGALSGACTAFVLCPSDVLKCRTQISMSKGVKKSVSEILRQTLKTQGVFGLYTGITAQIMRDIPFYAAFFGTYDVCCAQLRKHTELPDASVYFISGGFAGQAGWIVSIAPDTIKSTIQTSEAPLGIVATTRSIIAARGIGGLFAGMNVAIIRAFPANAALFVGYELSRRLMTF